MSIDWNAVTVSGNPFFYSAYSYGLTGGDTIRSNVGVDVRSRDLIISTPLPLINNGNDSYYVGGSNYYAHVTYPNNITFRYKETTIGTSQTFENGQTFKVTFDGNNVTFSVNHVDLASAPLPVPEDSVEFMKISVLSQSPSQNYYTFNMVNFYSQGDLPGISAQPVYASTIFQNVTLNNSDYNSFLGNHAVPKGYVDQKVADLVNGAPAALDTLKELSDALNGDANLATSLINLVSEEKSRAQTAEAAIQSSLSTKTTSLEAVTASLSADIIAETARALAAESKVASDLASETARALAAESKVASDLATESSRAQAAETKVASDLASETARALAAESKVASDLATESSRAQAAETKVASDLSTETARAQAAESKVASDLTAETVRAQAAETKVATDLAAEVVRSQAADAKVATDLTAEVVRAQAAEAKVSSELTAESVRAQAAETKVSTELAAESARAQAAEAKVATDLATETTRAQAAETKVASDLAAESVRALAAEAKVAADLSAESVRAQAAESKITAAADDLKIQVNNEVTRAQAADATLTSGLAAEIARATAAENTKVNLAGPNTLTGALTLQSGLKVSLSGNSYLYIGSNWRINAGNNGKTLLFEYNSNPSGGGLWATAVPFIQII